MLLLLAFGGRGEEEAPRRHQGVGRPDLLAGHAPAPAPPPPPLSPFAIPLHWPGRRQQRCQVGAGIGLAEALAPDDLTARNRRKVPAPLLRGAVPHDRRAHPVDAHVLRTPGLVVRPHLLADHRLLPRRGTAAAELLGPRQAEHAALRDKPP